MTNENNHNPKCSSCGYSIPGESYEYINGKAICYGCLLQNRPCCINFQGWCNGCTTCTDGKKTVNMIAFNRLVCKECGAHVERFSFNPCNDDEFVVLFKCGREVRNDPIPDPWVKEVLNHCNNS